MAKTNDKGIKYGIRITWERGQVGWIVGRDCDALLFDDRAAAVAALKKMKADDRYSWNCDAAVDVFTGLGK